MYVLHCVEKKKTGLKRNKKILFFFFLRGWFFNDGHIEKKKGLRVNTENIFLNS
jgi:hypothetical protein